MRASYSYNLLLSSNARRNIKKRKKKEDGESGDCTSWSSVFATIADSLLLLNTHWEGDKTLSFQLQTGSTIDSPTLFSSRLSSFDRVMSRESHPLLTRFTRPTSSLTKPNYLILPSRAKVGYARVPSYLLQISDFNLPMFGLPHAHTFVLSFVFLKFTFKFNLFIFVFDFFGWAVHVQVVPQKASEK